MRECLEKIDRVNESVAREIASVSTGVNLKSVENRARVTLSVLKGLTGLEL